MFGLIKFLFKLILIVFLLLVILFGYLFYTTRGEYSVAQTVEQNSSIPHIKIGNTIFHAQTFGDPNNQVVVVVHGGPGNDYRYLLPLKALSKEYFVVFYDQRGTGLSPRVDPSQHSLETSITDLGDIIDHYSPNRKVNIIGHSWGGMLASGYLAKHPEKINKIVLAEPGMLTNEAARRYQELFKFEPSEKMAKEIILAAFESLHLKNANIQDQADYVFGRMASLNLPSNPMRKYFCNEDLNRGYIPYWRYSGIASIEIMAKAMEQGDQIQINLVSGVEKFADKVLFIAGACDQIIGEKFQKEMHLKYFKNAQMIVIQDAGHTMFGEKPKESIKIIENYFKE